MPRVRICRMIADIGFEGTLRHMCEWAGSAGAGGADDRDVVEQARIVLGWLEGES